MLELIDANNIAYLFLSAANRWLEVRTVGGNGFMFNLFTTASNQTIVVTSLRVWKQMSVGILK